MSTRSILALELCLRFEAQAQAYLRSLLERTTPACSFQDKWNLYGSAASCLLANRALWVSGCWDFFDDDAKARGDFNMWVQGMLTQEGSRKEPSGSPDPYRGDPRHMTFTMAALMVQGTPSEQSIRQMCDIPQGKLWHGDTFEHVLRSMRYLNFASVEGSTMYLIPKEPNFALTLDDLKHPKFHYLRPIV